MSDSGGPWYYNLNTKQVVPEGADKAENLLGPYPTREDAERALAKVEERNEAWDNDPDWNDDVDEKQN
ncbi:hypothetical protein ACF3NT_01275 [Naumannella halotolerans]|uniref:SPOR domain-containing protein n=1 Tax=Naumannella halotolerans TaxID=993414 RepID=A0A4R7J5Q7_9ACTN|nr:hypothetical protein [Naumannella halotolerans]TDT32692.1 hypothetical protein CLV29_0277 [Naumannella halotolerans]